MNSMKAHMKVQSALVLLLLSLSGSALGQACGAGIPSAGNPACIPPDRESSPYYQGSYGSVSPSAPRGHWQLTWGAVAMSVNNLGDVGVTVGKFSKREAKRDAIAKCEALGGNKCYLELAYQNQCAVIAWASEHAVAVPGAVIVQGGPTIEVASRLALPSCIKLRNGRDCKIIYSDCTKPVLVQ
ncbi:MAG: DUF4189 domain-containing protein [Ktedonobacteraceae bacterium]|nr:DUF4189 domain-containing protein [Ktedonobacteraceae bacterium]